MTFTFKLIKKGDHKIEMFFFGLILIHKYYQSKKLNICR